MDFVLGCQLGHRFLFLQHLENDLGSKISVCLQSFPRGIFHKCFV